MQFGVFLSYFFCQAATAGAPMEHIPHFSTHTLCPRLPTTPLSLLPAPPSSESICLNQSHRRRSWIMYQPGFVNRFVNNAFGQKKRKEKKRKEEER